jgi:CRISPR-associated protein Cmr1
VEILEATLEILTPLFAGGASPNDRGEFRASSLRGILRSWAGRLFVGGEAAFGKAGVGSGDSLSSPLALSVSDPPSGSQPWGPLGFSRMSGGGYFGYSLDMGNNRRKAVEAGRSAQIRIIPRRPKLAEEARRIWAASLWCLDRFGGMGSRSRRGFGSVQLKEWKGWAETEKLRVTGQARDPKEWARDAEEGWEQIGRWFASPDERSRRLRGGKALILKPGYPGWKDALNSMGEKYREFRKGRPREARTALGLPVSFRDGETFEARGENVGRSASRALFKVIRLGDSRYYGVLTRLHGPLLPPGAEVTRNRGVRVATPGDGLLDGFFQGLQEQGEEVSFR